MSSMRVSRQVYVTGTSREGVPKNSFGAFSESPTMLSHGRDTPPRMLFGVKNRKEMLRS